MEQQQGYKMQKILIAGGGTGGHIFPALAIAKALQKKVATSLLFVGAKGKMEMEKVPQAGYKIEGINIVGFNRSSLIRNIGLPFTLIKSFFQVKKIIQSFNPTAVIGVGGYSTFPVLKYAQAKHIPTFIHESNSFAGKSNILLGKNATKIFVANDGMEAFFPAEKICITGNPVRKNIVDSTVSKEDAINFFGLCKNKKTVVAIGGSLGAKSINEAIVASINRFEENNLQLIWQTGKVNAEKYKEAAKGKTNIWVNEFIKEMEMVYAAADVVISRAGAMSVTELCVVAKPTIFVPFPFAAEDHQTINAMHLVNKQAALIVKDANAKEELINTVIDLSGDEALQKVLEENIKNFAIKNADEVIAKKILELIANRNTI